MIRFCATRVVPLAAVAAVLGACAGAESSPKEPSASGNAAIISAAAAPAVTPTGTIIEVGMFTDASGNYFSPKNIVAQRGDVVRFILKSGVHNVHFVADSNVGKGWLPPVSDYLQLPGQEYDLLVAMQPGKYYFQCDPHALLGMVGQLEVKGGSN